MALPSRELPEAALDALIARERTRVVAPLTEWRLLAQQLQQEGLMRGPGAASGAASGASAGAAPGAAAGSARGAHGPLPRGQRDGWLPAAFRWTTRAAAAALLVGGGIVVGRGMTLGNDLVTGVRAAMQADSLSGVHASGTPFRSAEQARRALIASQAEYQRAAAFLAASDTSGQPIAGPDVYRDRLAALDEMASASMNALRESPGDPLLNQYYLSAAAAREATLQQLGRVLPAGLTMVRF